MGNYENLGIDLLLDDDGDLHISATGDLAITPDGRTTLLQDVRHLLDTLPGDLFGHPDYGAGVPRLFGEEDRPDFEQWVARTIEDALTYDLSVGPRIKPDSIQVTEERSGREASFRVSFVPIEEGFTNRLVFVWNANKTSGDF